MRRLDVRYRPEAIADLRSILFYIRELSQSERMARGYVQRIQARCQKVGDAPHGGRPRDDLEPGLRTVSFERAAVIAYKIEAGKVSITNIFFGGRDFETLYRSRVPFGPVDG